MFSSANMAGTVLIGILNALSHLILSIIQSSRYYYFHFRFTDEDPGIP